jgi:hypothetical protein
MKRIMQIVLGCAVLLLVAGVALAEGTEKKAETGKMAKHPMAKGAMFLVESPHTQEECLAVMDEANKEKQLEKWDWGCMAGNHTAYRIVQAADENAALAMVPESVRAKAHAYKLSKMTPAQLEAAHKGHM